MSVENKGSSAEPFPFSQCHPPEIYCCTLHQALGVLVWRPESVNVLAVATSWKWVVKPHPTFRGCGQGTQEKRVPVGCVGYPSKAAQRRPWNDPVTSSALKFACPGCTGKNKPTGQRKVITLVILRIFVEKNSELSSTTRSYERESLTPLLSAVRASCPWSRDLNTGVEGESTGSATPSPHLHRQLPGWPRSFIETL